MKNNGAGKYRHPPTFSYRIANWLEELTVRSWWMGIVLLVCFMIYEQGTQRAAEEHDKLCSRRYELWQEKENALSRQEELERQLHSQSDPAWVALILKSKLGVVPDGQTKVFFDYVTTDD